MFLSCPYSPRLSSPPCNPCAPSVRHGRVSCLLRCGFSFVLLPHSHPLLGLPLALVAYGAFLFIVFRLCRVYLWPRPVVVAPPLARALSGGGLRVGFVSVGILRPFPVVLGTFEKLYDDDVVRLTGFSPEPMCEPGHNVVCVHVPLHLLVPLLATRHRSFMNSFLRSHCPRPSSLAFPDAALLLSQLCCTGSCTFVYACVSRPDDSVVNPFHINRASLGSLPPLGSARAVLVPACDPPTDNSDDRSSLPFPPTALSVSEKASVVQGFCRSISGDALHEGPCSVCARLVVLSSMKSVPLHSPLFLILRKAGIVSPMSFAVQPSASVSTGPVLCSAGMSLQSGQCVCAVCPDCLHSLSRSQLPSIALANGRWLGEVPAVLDELTFMEKILVARYRHNRCIVRVDKHAPFKMRANAIIFAQPAAELLRVLPMPREELDTIVAVLFTGSVAPTLSDFQRTPVLVRRSKVWDALIWLKQYNSEYADVTLSPQNLAGYGEDSIPVAFFHQPTPDSEPLATLSVADDNTPSGAGDGPCPMTIHGVTSDEVVTLGRNAQAVLAMRHLKLGGSVLAMGSQSQPERFYNNVSLFPGLFPWLFPYGYGGPRNARMTVKVKQETHLRELLLYYDRRFQTDPYFPFICFNQHQISQSTRGSFLTTDRKNFDHIAERILQVDVSALKSLSDRCERDGFVRAETDAERACYDLLSYVDSVAGHVPGSNTQRKYQRNEIRALIMEEGVPMFFITFAPPTYKNPLCLYFCGVPLDLDSRPLPMASAAERARASANNPVACARFFHVLVVSFIKHVLRHGSGEPGLFGETAAYYGTVEQQGRLSLHLHLLIWIKGCYSPAKVRECLLANESSFRDRLIAWLEDVHQGEFSTGSLIDVGSRVAANKKNAQIPASSAPLQNEEELSELYLGDPTAQLPTTSPTGASHDELVSWYDGVCRVTDEVVYLSNRHDESHNKGCRTARRPTCRARFPRDLYPESTVDPESGALTLKKKEAWINTYSVTLSYLLRCNSDVTCLLSGTMVRAVIAYVTDYVTKSSLKTHVVFDVIRSVIENARLTGSSDVPDRERARRLLGRMVNGMSGKSEIGGPMVCALLLGQPEHYTDRHFKVFFWTSYARVVADAWGERALPGEGDRDEVVDRVIISSSPDGFVPYSKVNDYTLRPREMESWCLVDYLRYTDLALLSDNDSPPTDSGSLPPGSEGAESPPTGSLYRLSHMHAKYNSHGVRVYRRRRPYVLNFVGPILPRMDRGDRDVYCRTMLTLFKPWRTGLELRASDVSWQETFDRTLFTPRQMRVMANMNVLYECRDAAHDLSSLNRAGVPPLPFMDSSGDQALTATGSSSRPSLSETDVLRMLELATANESSVFHKDRDLDEQTQHEFRTLRLTAGVQDVAGSLSARASMPFVSSKISPRRWRERVLLEKKVVLQHRLNPSLAFRSIPSVSISSKPDGNTVRVVTAADLDGTEYLSEALPGNPSACVAPTNQMRVVIERFSLNEAQRTAFVLIASRVTSTSPEPLRMYLGGMGGTGKSQVVKALNAFFHLRGEPHRFRVMAPTGSAAAQVDGSTYHSMFGFSKGNVPLSKTRLAALKDLHSSTDLFLLDEISMMSLSDFYKLSERMCTIFDSDVSFGGKHMVVCGDFGQLPPAGEFSRPLYSRSVSLSFSGDNDSQKAAMAKLLWHSFTTVVFLHENMRQRGMSEEDRAFRVALENARVAACTPMDIALLRSRVSGALPHQPHIGMPQFKYVSVISPPNARRDNTNDVCVEPFAFELQTSLPSFMSRDRFGTVASDQSTRATQRAIETSCDPVRTSDDPDLMFRLQLWSLPPRRTEHVAGRLRLCKGMPVLLKANEATELCATNGAEGIVVGWDAEVCPDVNNAFYLNTLFVKLVNPPRTVLIPGLDPDIIPIIPSAVSFTIPVGDRQNLRVNRTQVPILPNFAMTDFACQGRTREFNVVDLRGTRNHQSVYTMLSRGSSLLGTLILYPFDTELLTMGMSDDLALEFQSLALLAACTQAEFEGSLPFSTHGLSRSYVLSAFLQWKGEDFIPPHLHSSLHWKGAHPTLSASPEEPITGWCVVDDAFCRRNRAQIPKRAALPSLTGRPMMQPRVSAASIERAPLHTGVNSVQVPLGFRWDSIDYSCAYDSLFMILYNLLDQDGIQLGESSNTAESLPYNVLMQGFLELANSGMELYTPEQIRDRVRDSLQSRHDPLLPRRGAVPSNIDRLLHHLFAMDPPAIRLTQNCTQCLLQYPGDTSDFVSHVLSANAMLFPPEHHPSPLPTSYILHSLLSRPNPTTCSFCRCAAVAAKVEFLLAPKFLAIELNEEDVLMSKLSIDAVVDLSSFGLSSCWSLAGIVYLGDGHFTSRFVDNASRVWYHDGISQSNRAIYEGNTDDIDLTTLRGRKACEIFYVPRTTTNSTAPHPLRQPTASSSA